MNKDLDIRNEELLVLGLCRLSFNREHAVKIQDLIKTITDWKYFVFLANEHGIAGLLFHNLQQLGLIGFLPDEQVTFLKNALMMSMSRNAFHTQAITDILGLLNSEDIKTVLLKGLALELTVYGNKGLRQMTDIDILLDRKNYLRASEVLLINGYKSLPVKSIFHKSIIAYSGKHLPSLVKNGVSFDIHLELFSGKRNLVTNLLFENCTETQIKNQKAFIPQPGLFFLYLIRHLYQHEINNESQLRLYTDLVVLIEKISASDN